MPDIGLGQPMPDDPTDPTTDRFDELSDQEVEDRLSGKASAEPEPDEEPAPEKEPEPASGDDAVPPAETPAEPETAEVPLTPEERIAALESSNRIERLEREKAEAIAERERYLHSRNAGELGYLKKMLADRQGQDTYSAEPAEPATDEISSIRNDIAAIKAERSQQGIAEEVNAFQRAYPDAVKDEADMVAIMQTKLPDYQELLNSADPKMARTLVRSLLKETYADLRLSREQEAIKGAQVRSYDQAAKLKARKVVAGPASTTRTAPLRAAPKTEDDLTDAEVEALADEYVRSRA